MGMKIKLKKRKNQKKENMKKHATEKSKI